MDKLFIYIFRFFEKNRMLLFGLFGMLFLCLIYFSLQLKFEEDISKILPKDKKIDKLNQVFQESKFMDKLVVMVSVKDTMSGMDTDTLVEYANTFAEAVQNKLTPFISKINYKVDDDAAMQLFTNVNNSLPIYLTENDYQQIDSLITPSTLKATLAQDFRTLTSPAGIALKNIISNDPVGISLIALKKMQQIQYDENFELYDNFILTKNHHHLMMFITPQYPPGNTGKNEQLLIGLDKIIDSLSGTSKNVTAAYFGATAVSVGNALQLRKDSLLTQGIAVAFLIIFLGVYFRKKRAPFIILIPVLFGALFSLTMIYFIKGSISVIALGTGSVVLGIAINYSLHVFNHYRHTRSIEEIIKDLAMPLTIGSLTSVGGFLCLEFVKSEMLKDLGLFAAFSLIGASLCSLIFLPHFISSKKEQKTHVATKSSWIDTIASFKPEFNKYLVITIFLLTIVFAFTARKVSFETNMERMNFMPSKLIKAQDQLNAINAYSLQSIYLVAEGKTLNDALVNNEKILTAIDSLKEKKIVKKYSGVSTLIISENLQKQRIDRWNNYWTTEKKQQLLQTLQSEGKLTGFKPAAFIPFSNLLYKTFQPADSTVLANTRQSFLDDYITEKPGHATVVTLVKVEPKDKPIVYNTFDNNPLVTVVDKQYLTNKLVEIINSDFAKIALMSSCLVFFVLLLTFGRIELTLVSFIPMFLAWIWILGLMGIFGIQFNIVNIIVSALIFGLGDDYSLFIMDGLLREYKTGRKNLAAYKSSIFLSAITTIVGLGVLIFAKHPALRSIALISIIGIVCVVLMSQVLIPFLFSVLIKNRIARKQLPLTFFGLIKSIFAFVYFAVMSICLTIVGFILLKLNPFAGEKTKHFFHILISKSLWSLIYIMGNVKKKINNPLNEDFKKPAIIICNHQSFLDTFSIIMQNPKLILFTNKWVWNSPVFGGIVRLADYYYVANGAEGSSELLQDRVNNGYSVLIFPEGTRSIDGAVHRFHKGAFYLAEQLKLDILPIIIHGNGYTMSKGDFLLKDGHLTFQYLPRIKPDDTSFGIGYAERTKKIGRYFKEQYATVKNELEQTTYFRERLIYNYIYKGPTLEWYMKVKVSLEKNYQPFHELVPMQGKILDIGCGYGFMCYMLHFAGPERDITGIDYDEEKIATANHCYEKDALINFEYANVMEYAFNQYDCIIMADMLHYLRPEQQTIIIQKCIDSLKDGGTLIIRDGNADLEKRQKGTKLTEVFSTKIFGFNKVTADGLFFLSGSFIKNIAAKNNLLCTEIDQSKFTSNIVFVLKK